MKKKVCILLHGLGCDGISTLFANLSHNWTGNCDITYFLAVDNECKQFWDEFVATDNIKIIKLHDLDHGRIAKWPFTLYKALRKHGPFDVVHSNMDMLNGLNMFVAKICGVPNRISHSHRAGSENHGNAAGEIVKKIYRWSMKELMVSFSDVRLGCSEVAGEYFFGQNNFDILINGIDLSKYKRITPPLYN